MTKELEGQTKEFHRPEDETPVQGVEYVCYLLSLLIVVMSLPFSLFFIYKVAYQYERVVILRLGKVRKGGARGPGFYTFLPCVDERTSVDLRTLMVPVDPQQVLTKDSCTIKLDVIIFCRIEDPIKTVLAISNIGAATVNLASTTLRNIIGQKPLTEFLGERDSLVSALKMILDEGTFLWGIRILRVEIMGLSLPVAMQRAMASEAEATREAKAKLVAAHGELLASKALAEASNVMTENPITIHLRYLQTLISIAVDKNSTVILPLPTDLIKRWIQR